MSIFIPVSTSISGVRFGVYLSLPSYCSLQLLPYRGQVERRVCETNPNSCCNSCFVRGVHVRCVWECAEHCSRYEHHVFFYVVSVWPPSPHPLIDHVAHYKSKAAVALLQVANEGSFLTWLNGPDKESNEEINNLAIVALLILIHPACSAGIQWKAGYFFYCAVSAHQHVFFFFVD